jgi:hypothetical protein
VREFLSDEKDTEQNYFWKLILMKQAHLTGTDAQIWTWTPKLTEDMIKVAAVDCAGGSQVHTWSRP